MVRRDLDDVFQQVERTDHPDRARDREVAHVVELSQLPAAGRHGVGQTGGVEQREGHHFAPGGGVADAPVQRVRPVLGEADDVGRRLASGQAAAQPGNAGPQQDEPKPHRHAAVEAVREEVEGERPRRDEEDENPDRPVIETVVELIALPNLSFGSVLDGYRGHVSLYVWGCGLFGRDFRAFLDLADGDRPSFERRV